MFYKSTRNSEIKAVSAEAIAKGLSAEGGLFVPCEIPKLSLDDICALGEKTYPERAFEIFRLFLTDFTDEEIKSAVDNAYGKAGKFETERVTEITNPEIGIFVLELWHGPTCAFKDMALQILPHLLTVSVKKTYPGKKTSILVATSGDTGKAALEGFRDVPGTGIAVFYPEDGVSKIQRLQMTTQEGANVFVAGVRGNFDDCQNGVKAIFTDKAVAETLNSANVILSSANSINWGRLSPQIVYYISAYAELVKKGDIKAGEKINVAVPSGNFGNILAAYYAREMGLPINKLICASNKNKILTDFINTGIYDRNRPFYTTVSPSMDILISSNLERLLYHLCGEDDVLISRLFGELHESGRYEVGADVKEKLRGIFYAGYCGEEDTKKTVHRIFSEFSYLMDTHTATAYKVYDEYRRETGDDTKTLIVSTANPYKFVSAVYSAVAPAESEYEADEFVTAEKLEKLTDTTMPEALRATRDKEIRFKAVSDKTAEALKETVIDFLCCTR